MPSKPVAANVPLAIPFDSQASAQLEQVGGKADASLRLTQAGFVVPKGVVLTTAFFAPWINAIQTSRHWQMLRQADPQAWPQLCEIIQRECTGLTMTAKQSATLAKAIADLVLSDTFAVRSSSPDEDLQNASFAGGYETCLGVSASGLESAVRTCFASVFDARVLYYKQTQGLPLFSPQIAVIIQQQIASEVAGVGFSLNPINNDYDEAVIAANWGLGSSVVDGTVSPDHFVVDKTNGQILESRIGEKHNSIWLDSQNGTVVRSNPGAQQPSLNHQQIAEITTEICRVEEVWRMPIDLEWAYANGTLYLLQARPITRYVPLPDAMRSCPGEKRVLYGDAALSKGLTSNEPISPLGLDALQQLFFGILESWLGPLPRDPAPKSAMMFFAGGRMYVNYSGLLWLSSPEKLAKSAAPTDALMASILRTIDVKRYRSERRPTWLRLRLLWLLPRAVWRMRGFIWNLFYALTAPQRFHRRYCRRVALFQASLQKQVTTATDVAAYQRDYGRRLNEEIFELLMPALLVGLASPGFLLSRKNAAMREHAARLRLGVPGDVVVEMGIALYELAGLLRPSDLNDLEALAVRLERREMPEYFLNAWDRFIRRYGHRGPNEMDVMSPRYADDPRLALRQMSIMVVDDQAFDPAHAHQRQADEREQALQRLNSHFGPLRRALLRRIDRWIVLFAGTRDTPKHLLVLFNYGLRKRALTLGRSLAEHNRLDKADDVFKLAVSDLITAQKGCEDDLRSRAVEQYGFIRKLKAKVSTFPLVIDSRGRILRPDTKPDKSGRLQGMAVSGGIVSGTVKVLDSPHDKSVEKGDVIVAYATDPGWTPLFINAGAIILEVGGVLQHGALVAREFAKPCVVGIDRVTQCLVDGQCVEVNGDTGEVRLLDPN